MKTTKRICIISLILLISFVAIYFAGKFICKALFPIEHSDIILTASEKNDADPYLILALIKAESNFVSDAQSNKDAVGLMQITAPTAQWIAEKTDYTQYSAEKLKSPDVNISMGTWYLTYLMDLYNGNETLALCAYNAGRGNVDKWLKNTAYSTDGASLDRIPFPETSVYIKKIARYKQIYIRLYPDLF